MSKNTKLKRMNKQAFNDLVAAREGWKSCKGSRSNRAQHNRRFQPKPSDLWQGEHSMAYG